MITINATSTQVCLLSVMEQTENTVEIYSLRLAPASDSQAKQI